MPLADARFKAGHLWNGDCLSLMDRIPNGKIDFVFTDLPYGETDCSWDSPIDLDRFWAQLRRVCKPNAAVVLTATGFFVDALVSANRGAFRYKWYWIKQKKTGFCFAKHQPMRNVEECLVFYVGDQTPKYNPQDLIKIPKRVGKPKRTDDGVYRKKGLDSYYTTEFTNYPHQTLMFAGDEMVHSTQKPVALVSYFIKTYTDPGAIVLDATCGSGSTAVAAARTGRRFVCIEKDEVIFEQAVGRVKKIESNPGFVTL